MGGGKGDTQIKQKTQFKNKKVKWAGGYNPVAEHLPSIYRALCSVKNKTKQKTMKLLCGIGFDYGKNTRYSLKIITGLLRDETSFTSSHGQECVTSHYKLIYCFLINY